MYMHMQKSLFKHGKVSLGRSHETLLETRCAIFLKETSLHTYMYVKKVSLKKITHLISNKVS